MFRPSDPSQLVDRVATGLVEVIGSTFDLFQVPGLKRLSECFGRIYSEGRRFHFLFRQGACTAGGQSLCAFIWWSIVSCWPWHAQPPSPTSCGQGYAVSKENRAARLALFSEPYNTLYRAQPNASNTSRWQDSVAGLCRHNRNCLAVEDSRVFHGVAASVDTEQRDAVALDVPEPVLARLQVGIGRHAPDALSF